MGKKTNYRVWTEVGKLVFYTASPIKPEKNRTFGALRREGDARYLSEMLTLQILLH